MIKRIVLLSIVGILTLVLMAPGLSAAAVLPAPVSVTAEVTGAQVNLTWRAPSASVGNFTLVGCDSTRALMVEVYSNFTAAYPSINITFGGGGNDVGVREWVNHNSTVAMMSRPFTGGETLQARAAGLNVTSTMVAVESIAIIAGPGAGISQLSAGQLKGLYTGNITNWQQVGGADLPVMLVAPGPRAPPRLFFNTTVMGGEPFAATTMFVNDSLACAEAVANTTGALGFVRAGYLDRAPGATILNISGATGGEAISPLDWEAAYNDTYRLARQLYLYTDGAPANALGMWMDYLLSPDGGQRIAVANGFLPLTVEGLNASRAMIASTSDPAVLSYKVYREGPEGTTITEVNATGMNDTAVKVGTAYSYSVSAIYATGEGERSAPVMVTVLGTSTSAATPVTTEPGPMAVPALMGGAAILALVVIALILRRR